MTGESDKHKTMLEEDLKMHVACKSELALSLGCTTRSNATASGEHQSKRVLEVIDQSFNHLWNNGVFSVFSRAASQRTDFPLTVLLGNFLF